MSPVRLLHILCLFIWLLAGSALAGTEEFEQYGNGHDLSTEPMLLNEGVRFQNEDTCEIAKGTCFLTGLPCTGDDDCFLFADQFADYRPCVLPTPGACAGTGFTCSTDDDCLIPLSNSLTVNEVFNRRLFYSFSVCFDEPVGEVEWQRFEICGGRGTHVHVRDAAGNASERCFRCNVVAQEAAPISCVTVRGDGCAIYDLLQWRPPVCIGIQSNDILALDPVTQVSVEIPHLSIPDLQDEPAAACSADTALPTGHVATPRFVRIEASEDARSPIDLVKVRLYTQNPPLESFPVGFDDVPPPDTVIESLATTPNSVRVVAPMTYGSANPTDLAVPFPTPTSLSADLLRLEVTLRGSACSKDSGFGGNVTDVKALWQIPTTFAREGCRTTGVGGHDSWATRTTIDFLNRHSGTLPAIGDVSAEHGQRFGSHRGHTGGLDFDTFHFAQVADPPGFASPPGSATSGVWNLARLRGWAAIAADPSAPDFGAAQAELGAFALATRAGLTSLASDDVLRRITTADGEAIPTGGASEPTDGWISSLVRTGELPTTSGPVAIVAGTFDDPKVGWQDDHNAHNHISLCPAGCTAFGDGGCRGGHGSVTCP